MSSEEFRHFVHAIEHSFSLRQAAKSCRNNQKLIDLASEYGFSINESDIKDKYSTEKINNWFKSSEIAPIKNVKPY